jgi:hypothetical protein
MEEIKELKPTVGRFINKRRDSMHFILGAATVTIGFVLGASVVMTANKPTPSK